MQSQVTQFSWPQMGMSIILMVIMAFFCTGGVEVAKDLFYYTVIFFNRIKFWLRKFYHNTANHWRLPDKQIIITYMKPNGENTYFSGTASKVIAFFVALWLCIAIDYGAIDDIVQYGMHAKGMWATYTDYVFTASIIRLGAIQVYDLLAMLTEKALAAKTLAAKLTASPTN